MATVAHHQPSMAKGKGSVVQHTRAFRACSQGVVWSKFHGSTWVRCREVISPGKRENRIFVNSWAFINIHHLEKNLHYLDLSWKHHTAWHTSSEVTCDICMPLATSWPPDRDSPTVVVFTQESFLHHPPPVQPWGFLPRNPFSTILLQFSLGNVGWMFSLFVDF